MVKNPKMRVSQAGIAQLVERNLAKVEVASSSLVSRSKHAGPDGATAPAGTWNKAPVTGFCFLAQAARAPGRGHDNSTRE